VAVVAKCTKAKPCRVCDLLPHQVAYIDANLLEGKSPRALAEGLKGVTRQDIRKHSARCPNSKAYRLEEADSHAEEDE
jgi:hypothetical protein